MAGLNCDGRGVGSLGRVSEYIFPPLITLLVCLASMAVARVFPFGDGAMLYDDAAIQYVGFFGWYHQVLNGDASLFYSFAKSLGGPTITLFAYYLASPLSLLAYFFEPASIPQLFSLLIPVKLSLASLSCYVFLRKRLRVSGLPFVLVSSAYGLAACNLEAGSNIMWLDGVYLLPIACLFVSRLVREGKPFALVLCVGFAVLSNWYAGYILCLACVGYFFCEVYLTRLSLRDFLRIGCSFAGAMLLGILLSMPLFFPVIQEMLVSSGSGIAESGFVYTIENFGLWPTNLTEVLGSFYMGTDQNPFVGAWGIRPGNFPIAALCLLLAVSSFVAAWIPASRKRLFAVALSLMMLSVLVKPLDMVWTGFTRSDSYNPRYMFVIVFSIVVIAAYALRELRMRDRKEQTFVLVKSLGILALVALLLALDGWSPRLPVLAAQALLLAVAAGALVASFAKSGVHARKASRVIPAIVLVLAVSLESGYIVSHQMKEHYAGSSIERYRAYFEEMSQCAPDYHEAGFYRLGNAAMGSRGALFGTDDPVPTGEGLALGVPTLSHYSSSGNQPVNELLGNLGYCLTPGTRAITYYRTPIFLTDSVLGIDRVVWDERPFGTELEFALTDLSGSGAQRALYRNDAALSLGFGVKEGASSFEWHDSPFDNQSEFVGRMVGEEASVYEEAQIEGPNVEAGSVEVTWTLTALDTGPLYAFVTSPQTMVLSANGVVLQTVGSWEFDTNVVYLGEFDRGQSVDIALSGGTVATEPLSEACSVSAASLNPQRAEQLLSMLATNQAQIAAFDDGEVRCSFEAREGESLLLTIPYDPSWAVYVDGETVDARSYQGLMLIDMDPGVHEVSLSYSLPRGLLVGVALAGASSACCFVWWLLRRRALKEEADGRA